MITNVQNFNYNGNNIAIQIFNNPLFGQIRTLEVENNPYFVGNDVAIALGYAKPRNAIIQHVDNEDALKWGIPDNQGLVQETTIINESGVYSLVFGSKLPTAKQFKRWVTKEVLPSIRKTGGYVVTKSNDTPEEIMARAIMVAQETIKNREKRIAMLEAENTLQSQQLKESAPKIEYFDKALSSTGTYTATQIGKEFGWGAETLNRKLKEMGVHYKQNGQWILYAKYDGKEYTRSIPRTFTKSDGTTGSQMQTVWTEKGRLFIHNLLKGGKSC